MKRAPRVFTISDVNGGPKDIVRPALIQASLPPKHAYAHRGVNTPCQGFVYDHARVFGTGNPRTSFATAGEGYVVQRRNTSKFSRA